MRLHIHPSVDGKGIELTDEKLVTAYREMRPSLYVPEFHFSDQLELLWIRLYQQKTATRTQSQDAIILGDQTSVFPERS